MSESPVAVVASWVTLAASFALSYATWLALGELAGYGALAFALALCVDGYIVVALVTWLAPVSERVARFARWNTYGAAGVGVLAQSTYHGASVWAATHTSWRAALATVVGALPPLVSALSVHLRGLVRHAVTDPAAENMPADMPVEVADPPAGPALAPVVRQTAITLADRVRPLVAEGLGRTSIAKRLGIKPHQARQAIDAIKREVAA